MRSYIRGFLLLLLLAVVSDPAIPRKAVPVIALVVITWAVWRMTAPGKRTEPAVAVRDYDAHAMTTTDKEPITEDQKSSVLFIDGVPIPDDAHVSPAPQSASETQKRLLGAWVGTWNDSCRHILIVEDIRADGEARVVCADSSEWSREEGTVSGNTLCLNNGVTYMLIATTDMLLATLIVMNLSRQARMSRIELAALTRPGATINWPDGVEFLDTDLTENGKRVRLEVVLFKPKGSGPFPLLVFNHGRIYRGPPTSLTETHPELAEFFLEKGWMVAFPQRRGRGKSDGLHKEGLDGHEALTRTETSPEFAAFFLEWGWTVAFPRHELRWVYDPGISRPGAERALNDIEAAIAALQRRPDVAGKRLLIGGLREGESCRSRMRDYIPNRSPASSTLLGAGSASVIGGQARSTEHCLSAARDMIERRCGSTAGEFCVLDCAQPIELRDLCEGGRQGRVCRI